MDQAIGVDDVRAAIRAHGESAFEIGDIEDQLDVDGDAARSAIRKALGYMTKLDELRREDGAYDHRTACKKPTRWKVMRLNDEGAVPKFKDDALFGAMLGWKLTR